MSLSNLTIVHYQWWKCRHSIILQTFRWWCDLTSIKLHMITQCVGGTFKGTCWLGTSSAFHYICHFELIIYVYRQKPSCSGLPPLYQIPIWPLRCSSTSCPGDGIFYGMVLFNPPTFSIHSFFRCCPSPGSLHAEIKKEAAIICISLLLPFVMFASFESFHCLLVDLVLVYIRSNVLILWMVSQ